MTMIFDFEPWQLDIDIDLTKQLYRSCKGDFVWVETVSYTHLLPILPEHWQMVVGKDKKKQFDILKKLMNAPDVTEVVNACDAGREGELI